MTFGYVNPSGDGLKGCGCPDPETPGRDFVICGTVTVIVSPTHLHD
ncbi:hypothetical protein ISS37_03300 [candidate division KSB1 bacterium]|nr:hypothetical protein [candidate division KSB1 bacterium]